MRARKERKKKAPSPGKAAERTHRLPTDAGERPGTADAVGEGATPELVEESEGRDVRLREQDTQRDNVGPAADPGLPHPRRRARESGAP